MNKELLADQATAWPLLGEAAAGLVYVSETDAPFEPVQARDPKDILSPGVVRELAGRGSAERVEELSITEFFAALTEDEEWHGAPEKRAVERYRAVKRIFETRLAEARVFRVGTVRVAILLVGQTADGRWVGLRTTAVET